MESLESVFHIYSISDSVNYSDGVYKKRRVVHLMKVWFSQWNKWFNLQP